MFKSVLGYHQQTLQDCLLESLTKGVPIGSCTTMSEPSLQLYTLAFESPHIRATLSSEITEKFWRARLKFIWIAYLEAFLR